MWKGFLDSTNEEWEETARTNVTGPAAFARESILAFKESKEYVLSYHHFLHTNDSLVKVKPRRSSRNTPLHRRNSLN